MKVVFLDMDGVLVTRLPGVAESKLVRSLPLHAPHGMHTRFGRQGRQRAVDSAPRHVAIIRIRTCPARFPCLL